MIQNSGYLSELHDELLKDALVFGVDSDIVRKKCIAQGNRIDEATRLQLQAMTIEADTTQVKEPKVTQKPNGEARETKKTKKRPATMPPMRQ